MKTRKAGLVSAIAVIVFGTAQVSAQQVAGTLGSPGATSTISGSQLPAPDPKFGGVIKDDALPAILQWDESFDIGSDTLTGVNDADYKPPFALTAKLNKLTIQVDRPQLSPADIKKLQATMQEKAKAD